MATPRYASPAARTHRQRGSGPRFFAVVSLLLGLLVGVLGLVSVLMWADASNRATRRWLRHGRSPHMPRCPAWT